MVRHNRDKIEKQVRFLQGLFEEDDMKQIIRTFVDRPDYRNNGQYQFVKGYTGGGAQMCAHLTAEVISERCNNLVGPGTLVDDGENLWWEQAKQLSPNLLP